MRAIWEQEQKNKMKKLNLQLLSNFVKAVRRNQKVKTKRWKKTTTPKNKCDANFLFRWTVMLIVGFYKWICFQNTKVCLESEIPKGWLASAKLRSLDEIILARPIRGQDFNFSFNVTFLSTTDINYVGHEVDSQPCSTRSRSACLKWRYVRRINS